MTIRVKREYGNGISVEVEGSKMTEVLLDLSQADELFYDIRAFGTGDNGSVVVSDKVKFSVRHAKTSQGKPCKYYEQVCVEKGPLQHFRRHIGEFQERPGEVYVRKSPPKDADKYVMGYAGWAKYIAGGDPVYDDDNSGSQNRGQYGGGHSNNGVYNQQQSRSQQQNNNRSENAHASPPRGSSISLDDVPF